jgi:hypothetical protein
MSQTKSQLIEGSAASELTAAKTLLGAGSAGAPSLTATGDTNTGIFFPTADTIAFAEGGVETVRIDSSGRVGIGTGSPGNLLHVESSFSGTLAKIKNNAGSTSADTALEIESSTTAAKTFLVKNAGTETFYVKGEGTSYFSGSVGIGSTNFGGKLTVRTSTSNGAPLNWDNGQLVVTTGTGAASLGIALSVNSADNSASITSLTPGVTWNPIHYRGSSHIFYRSDASTDEVARLDTSGRLLVGTSSGGSGATDARQRIIASATNNLYLGCNGPGGWRLVSDALSDGGGFYHINFLENGSQRGSITSNGSSTSYTTTSDYRLKENVTIVTDGITRLQQLKPSRFNFITNPAMTVDGFIAHEVQAIVPEAITGEKNAVDDDGNPIYQGIDQSKLVPLLTAALQEAIGRIETLEAEVSALKGA